MNPEEVVSTMWVFSMISLLMTEFGIMRRLLLKVRDYRIRIVISSIYPEIFSPIKEIRSPILKGRNRDNITPAIKSLRKTETQIQVQQPIKRNLTEGYWKIP